jgi:hypothetical protein
MYRAIAEAPEEVTVSKYWQRGGMMTLRSALSWSHEENEWNCFRRQYPDLNPEWYGVEKPLAPNCCPHCKRPMNDNEDEY